MSLDTVYTSLREKEGIGQTENPQIETSTTRTPNIGNSNYFKMPLGYQPWDIWKVYHMNPWDADILKRLLRTKIETGLTAQESRKLDYQKIIHICQERINQIDEGYEF